MDRWDKSISGACALLAHALLIALLAHQTGNGLSKYRGNGQTHGDSLVIYPMMASPSANRTSPAAPAAKTTTADASTAEPSALAQKQILATTNPDATHPLSQSGSNAGTHASERDTSRNATLRTTASVAASISSGSSGENTLLASYQAAIRTSISSTWQRLSKRDYPAGCTIHLSQSPGGIVTATSAAACGLSREDQFQLEAAALIAQPMPYAGYEPVFSSEMDLAL